MYKTPESPTSPPPTPSPLTLPRSSGEILPVTTPIETLPTRITKQEQPELVRGEAAEELAEALEKFRRLTGIAPLVAIGRQARRKRGGAREGLLHRKKAGTWEFRERGPFFRVSRYSGWCGRFRHARRSSA